MFQWVKNLFAEKKLIAIVKLQVALTRSGEELWVNDYTVYCYLQGTKRKAKIVGSRFHRGFIKREHKRWTHCVEPWLKYGYTRNLQPYMVGDYGTTSLDKPKSSGSSEVSSD